MVIFVNVYVSADIMHSPLNMISLMHPQGYDASNNGGHVSQSPCRGVGADETLQARGPDHGRGGKDRNVQGWPVPGKALSPLNDIHGGGRQWGVAFTRDSCAKILVCGPVSLTIILNINKPISDIYRYISLYMYVCHMYTYRCLTCMSVVHIVRALQRCHRCAVIILMLFYQSCSIDFILLIIFL